MFEDFFSDRQQYIKVKNELKREADTNVFIKGNQKKAELDKRLDELSIKGGIVVSGRVIRQNIMKDSASASHDAALPLVVDTDAGVRAKEKNEQEENNTYSSYVYDMYQGQHINRGKEIIESFNKNDKRNINKGKFNKNI